MNFTVYNSHNELKVGNFWKVNDQPGLITTKKFKYVSLCYSPVTSYKLSKVGASSCLTVKLARALMVGSAGTRVGSKLYLNCILTSKYCCGSGPWCYSRVIEATPLLEATVF